MVSLSSGSNKACSSKLVRYNGDTHTHTPFDDRFADYSKFFDVSKFGIRFLQNMKPVSLCFGNLCAVSHHDSLDMVRRLALLLPEAASDSQSKIHFVVNRGRDLK